MTNSVSETSPSRARVREEKKKVNLLVSTLIQAL
jgi:hypothetical protein